MLKGFRYPLLLLMATIIVFTACTSLPGSSEDLGANSYYVDSQNGDDNNSGTSENTPWKTLEKVSSMSAEEAKEYGIIDHVITNREDLDKIVGLENK